MSIAARRSSRVPSRYCGFFRSPSTYALQLWPKDDVANLACARAVAADFTGHQADRLLPSGARDKSFHGGEQVLSFIPSQTSVNALAAQPDGSVFLVGGIDGNFLVTKLKDNGNTDNSFGNFGALTPAAGFLLIRPSFPSHLKNDFSAARARATDAFDNPSP